MQWLGGSLEAGRGQGPRVGLLPHPSSSAHPRGSWRPGLRSEALEGLGMIYQFPPTDALGPCPEGCLTPSVPPRPQARPRFWLR